MQNIILINDSFFDQKMQKFIYYFDQNLKK